MIAHVSGTIVEKFENSLIIDVGGIGYEVLVANGDFEAAQLHKTIKLHTYDHLRENAHELFGFSSLAGKKLFELLISVSGVGPRMGLSLLSLGPAEQVRSAVAAGDVSFVQRANGVGKRLAERVVVDLRDKVGLPTIQTMGSPARLAGSDDALDALMALGYTLQEATQALSKTDAGLTTSERIRQSLQQMGK